MDGREYAGELWKKEVRAGLNRLDGSEDNDTEYIWYNMEDKIDTHTTTYTLQIIKMVFLHT